MLLGSLALLAESQQACFTKKNEKATHFSTVLHLTAHDARVAFSICFKVSTNWALTTNSNPAMATTVAAVVATDGVVGSVEGNTVRSYMS